MTNKTSKQDEAELSCEQNAFGHRIGQRAHDSGHGARAVGPQICLYCDMTWQQIILADRQAIRKAAYTEGFNDGQSSLLDHGLTNLGKADPAIGVVAEIRNVLLEELGREGMADEPLTPEEAANETTHNPQIQFCRGINSANAQWRSLLEGKKDT